MEQNKSKHIHKFKRVHYKKTGNSVFFCTLPDCHFKIGTEFSLGKRNLCNRCGEPSLIDEYSIRLAKPICVNCRGSKTKKEKKNDNNIGVTNSATNIAKSIAHNTAEELKQQLNNVLVKPYLETDDADEL